MNIPIPKLKAVLRYFGTYTDARFLGKVKLMKLLYFLDFMHVKKYGCPVTWDRYINLEHGPIPTTILNLVNEAIDDVDNSILSDAVYFQRSENTDMCRMIPVRKFNEADEEYFRPSELKVLEHVCKRFGDKNTKYIEDASHKEAPWTETVLMEEIPYSMAVKDNDCAVSREEIDFFQNIK